MAQVKTINVKGKQYAEVSARLQAFREEHPDWTLTSDVIHLDLSYCAIKAVIRNSEGVIIAEGVAMEEHAQSGVNSTSFVENCETSAWGRALANLGYGCDGAIASAQELLLALQKQNNAPASVSQPRVINNTPQPQRTQQTQEKPAQNQITREQALININANMQKYFETFAADDDSDERNEAWNKICAYGKRYGLVYYSDQQIWK